MKIEFGKWRDDNPHCFYRTPREVVEALLARERFAPPIWECACGDGGIGQPLIEAYGDQNALCTDLINYGDPVLHGDKDYTWFQVYARGGVDFLRQTRKVPTIVSNLPFGGQLARMVEHALDLATYKVALLMEDRHMERNDVGRFYRNGMLKTIYKLQWKLRFSKGGDYGPPCNFGHHWAVWEKSHRGAAVHVAVPRPRTLESMR